MVPAVLRVPLGQGRVEADAGDLDGPDAPSPVRPELPRAPLAAGGVVVGHPQEGALPGRDRARDHRHVAGGVAGSRRRVHRGRSGEDEVELPDPACDAGRQGADRPRPGTGLDGLAAAGHRPQARPGAAPGAGAARHALASTAHEHPGVHGARSAPPREHRPAGELPGIHDEVGREPGPGDVDGEQPLARGGLPRPVERRVRAEGEWPGEGAPVSPVRPAGVLRERPAHLGEHPLLHCGHEVGPGDGECPVVRRRSAREEVPRPWRRAPALQMVADGEVGARAPPPRLPLECLPRREEDRDHVGAAVEREPPGRLAAEGRGGSGPVLVGHGVPEPLARAIAQVLQAQGVGGQPARQRPAVRAPVVLGDRDPAVAVEVRAGQLPGAVRVGGRVADERRPGLGERRRRPAVHELANPAGREPPGQHRRGHHDARCHEQQQGRAGVPPSAPRPVHGHPVPR